MLIQRRTHMSEGPSKLFNDVKEAVRLARESALADGMPIEAFHIAVQKVVIAALEAGEKA
jgi:hypothetical protein